LVAREEASSVRLGKIMVGKKEKTKQKPKTKKIK